MHTYEFDNNHRFFIQYMLTNGSVTLANTLSFLEKIDSAQKSVTHLKTLLLQINREIGNQRFKIVISPCEITGDELVIWLNTRNDGTSRQQLGYSAIETEYFHAVMQEIAQSEEHRILYPRFINITSTLTAQYSRENGEKVLNRWIHGGYFVKVNEYIYLGSRTILEFTTYFKTIMEANTCDLCSEIVFIGSSCNRCSIMYHSHCMDKYLQHQHTCPSCKCEWQQEATDNSPCTEAMDTDEETETRRKKRRR